jgi:hypothetical protein
MLFDVGGVDFQALRQVVSRVFDCVCFSGCHYGISNDPLVCFVPAISGSILNLKEVSRKAAKFTQRRKVESSLRLCVFLCDFA